MITYWLPKMHKTLIGSKFFVASKTSSTKPLSDITSKVFKMNYNNVEIFHEKNWFTLVSKNSVLFKIYSQSLIHETQ